MQQNNQLWIVLSIIAAFIAFGFTYKYTLAPSARTAGNTVPAMEHMDASANVVRVAEIGRAPDDLPPPIDRTESKTVKVELEAIAVRGMLADGVEYEYWTYNRQVPGPFIRVREGDTVEMTLYHNPAGHSHSALSGTGLEIEGLFDIDTAYADTGHMHEEADAHTAGADAGAHAHATHSVDLHAVLGPGGGAMLSQAKDGERKTFAWKAMRPGIYVYHCASPHIPTHIANGMYGLVLVEPKEGMSKVDREFYVMQGELYTAGKFGEKGYQAFDLAKLQNERPEYFVFNGRVGSLSGVRALHAKKGETVRIFFGVGSFVPSNFHLIGGVFDKLFPEGDIISPPHRNVQTTLVPAGGATVIEMEMVSPGKLLLVDHVLTRAIDKGAVGEFVVEGSEEPDIIRAIP